MGYVPPPPPPAPRAFRPAVACNYCGRVFAAASTQCAGCSAPRRLEAVEPAPAVVRSSLMSVDQGRAGEFKADANDWPSLCQGLQAAAEYVEVTTFSDSFRQFERVR